MARYATELLIGYDRVFEGGPGSGPQGGGEGDGGGSGDGGSGGGGSSSSPAAKPGLLSRMGTAVKNAVMGTPEERAHQQLAQNYENAVGDHAEAIADHGDINHPEVQAAKAKMDEHYSKLTPNAINYLV